MLMVFLKKICFLQLTSFDGLLRTSPTPPPFRRPWFRTVTMHMRRVSHVLSIPSSYSSSAIRIHKLHQATNSWFKYAIVYFQIGIPL